MTGRFFGRQLAIYAAYHRDARSKATHFIGIPAIVLSLLSLRDDLRRTVEGPHVAERAAVTPK